MGNHSEVGDDGDKEKKEQKFGRLTLKDVVLLLGKENDADELSFRCDKIGLCDADRNAVFLSRRLEKCHFLF
jgi:hypothetical protein